MNDSSRPWRPTAGCWRRCGWVVLVLAFATSAVIELVVAVSMAVAWPLVVAVPSVGLGVCCAVAAWRVRDQGFPRSPGSP